ncbi:MAG: cell envelope integrity protein TolA [Deltaproteobacteria bacterium]|jgi:outer membrane biosynthesis protein TonB|nr:cell envelope integrity protein TolA [Deltaproteobacteria bacterium]
MLTPRNPYNPQEMVNDPNFFLVMAVSVILHGLVLSMAYYLPTVLNLQSSRELPFDVMTVQLVGSFEPPAPAAPAAPVDPGLQGPNVVELPQADPIIPQPTPLERMSTPVIPTDAIPIGERPPEVPIEQVTKVEEPPPKVTPPKVEEPIKANPKQKAKAPNPDAAINKRIEELRRKTAAENSDEAINSAIGDIAKRVGKGDGFSSNQQGSNVQGNYVDQAKIPYYSQIRDIVRANWVPISGTVSGNIEVQFVIVIQPNGRISGKRVRRSSGNLDFDRSVEMALERSVFPPLPEAFNGQPDNPVMAFSLNYLNRV